MFWKTRFSCKANELREMAKCETNDGDDDDDERR